MKVLLAVDFSEVSERRVHECAARLWPAGTVLRVFGVAARIPPSAAELWFDAAGSLEAVWQAREERIQELVGKAAESLRQSGATVETSVRVGRRRKSLALATRRPGCERTTRRTPDRR